MSDLKDEERKELPSLSSSSIASFESKSPNKERKIAENNDANDKITLCMKDKERNHSKIQSHRSNGNLSCSNSQSAVATAQSPIICNTSRLFVGNLHRSITDAHLHKLFQPYGTIEQVFLVLHKESDVYSHSQQPHNPNESQTKHRYSTPRFRAGQPKGYAFVKYESMESARMAIRHLDQRLLLKRRLVVKPAIQKTGPTFASSSDENRDSNDPHSKRRKIVRNEHEIKKESSSIELKIQQVKMAIEAKKKRKGYL